MKTLQRIQDKEGYIYKDENMAEQYAKLRIYNRLKFTEKRARKQSKYVPHQGGRERKRRVYQNTFNLWLERHE